MQLSAANAGAVVAQLKFDDKGLITAITRDADDPAVVLMVAFMNAEAVTETLMTGQVTYFSRSRQALWRKGETSGQRQALIAIRTDCDADCLLLDVQQTGVACHTGRRSCFYQRVEDGGLVSETQPLISPEELYGKG